MNKLNEIIKIRGVKKEYLANKLGISRVSFSYKLNGKSRFTVDEALILAALLELTYEEFKDVFSGDR